VSASLSRAVGGAHHPLKGRLFHEMLCVIRKLADEIEAESLEYYCRAAYGEANRFIRQGTSRQG
jgi:hypothetical protein